MAVNPHIFREYDIRGVMDRDLTPAIVGAIGAEFATITRQALVAEGEIGAANRPLRLVVGRDGRLSSPVLAEALIQGMLQAGCQVTDIGLMPTPGLYYAAHRDQADAGIMITGSHNPPDHNGLKMVVQGRPFWGEAIRQLGQRLTLTPHPSRPGGERRLLDLRTEYRQRLVQEFEPGRPLKVVLDCGNGATGIIVPELMANLPGITSTILYPQVDGTFPNHHPDPTDPANLVDLQAKVAEMGADLGIAFDGDGDRLGVVDDQGGILWGDRLLILFARELLQRLPGSLVIGDVKCSQLLFDAVAQANGQPLMWKTGHSLIKAKMQETRAPLAGEMSGHFFFADRYYGFDDALYAAVRLLRLVAASPIPLSHQLADLTKVYATPELRLYCPDERKFAVMERMREQQQQIGSDRIEIDGIRVRLADGWWLLRVSNTQPALVARVEATHPAALHAIVAQLAEWLATEGVTIPAWELA